MLLHFLERAFEAVFIAHQFGEGLGRLGQALDVEVGEDRRQAHDLADGRHFRVGHVAVGRRDQQHGINQRVVMVDAHGNPRGGR